MKKRFKKRNADAQLATGHLQPVSQAEGALGARVAGSKRKLSPEAHECPAHGGRPVFKAGRAAPAAKQPQACQPGACASKQPARRQHTVQKGCRDAPPSGAPKACWNGHAGSGRV